VTAETEPRSAYDHPGGRRFSARDAVLVVGLAALLLLLFQGPSIRRSGERMNPGVWRSVVLAVGKPAGWLGDRLPLDEFGDRLTSWLSPDEDLGGGGGFDETAAGTTGRAVPPVTPGYFDPGPLGAKTTPRRLHTLLVTGDSLVMPLDTELARRLTGSAVRVVRDPHVGTGISKSILLDWGKLSARQASDESPDAIVVFIGANEGFPMKGADGEEVKCCGPDWAAIYANRARRMMTTYARGGAARVYWLTLPAPRDGERAKIARNVNAAIAAGAAPYRSVVRVLDMGSIFTPGGRYRDAMEIDGREQIVREADGIHLNDAGSKLAADTVMDALDRDFDW
jgi:lysophospholipase L1-like esterase